MCIRDSPEDRERFLTAFIGSNIRKEFSEGRMEVPAEYRRLGSDGKWYWVSAFIVPLCGHDSCRTDKGILLVRDISEQREEEQRRRISEQYDHALRNIYDELYELNITQEMCIRDSLGTGHFELLANRNDLATDTSGDYAAHFELFFGHILPPVSYTHLDVYKRQASS